jgi:hypothetical protein
MRSAVEQGRAEVGGGGDDGWSFKPYGSVENVTLRLETAELGAVDMTDPSASTSSQG